MASQSKTSPYTKVVNDTGLDNGDIAPAIVSVTIQESGARAIGYTKSATAAGLYASLLGAAGLASPPSSSSAGWAVSIMGLLLAGKSTHDISHQDAGKSHSRVLYLGDAVSYHFGGQNCHEIIMYRAYMDGNILKITEYFVPDVDPSLYNASDIIKGYRHGDTVDREVKDLFTFTFPEPQVINLYRYVSIHGVTPTPTSGTHGSGLPSDGLPKQGSLVLYDAGGKFLAQWDGGKQEEVVDRFGDGLFDPKDDKPIRHNIVSFVQEMKPQLSSSMSILHLSDKHNTPVLFMSNWKVSDAEWQANAPTQEEVMQFLKSERRGWNVGYQWTSDGDIYRCQRPFHYRKDYMTRKEGSHLFIVLTDTDWTYTTRIVKKD